MYTVTSNATQPIIIIKQERSLCSRITAFILTLVCTYILVSTVVSVGVFMAASDESLRTFMKRVEAAAEDLAAGKVSPAVEQAKVFFFELKRVEPTPAPIIAFIPRAVTIVSLVALVCSLIGCALYVAYLNYPEFQVAVDCALVQAREYAAQLYAELSATAASVYQQVMTFDYEGLFRDFVAFCKSVLAEIKSYFGYEEAAAAEAVVDEESQVPIVSTPVAGETMMAQVPIQSDDGVMTFMPVDSVLVATA
jgi:hypothetical protein